MNNVLYLVFVSTTCVKAKSALKFVFWVLFLYLFNFAQYFVISSSSYQYTIAYVKLIIYNVYNTFCVTIKNIRNVQNKMFPGNDCGVSNLLLNSYIVMHNRGYFAIGFFIPGPKHATLLHGLIIFYQTIKEFDLFYRSL